MIAQPPFVMICLLMHYSTCIVKEGYHMGTPLAPMLNI